MRDKRCVIQDDLKDCGISSLLSIIRYYHGDVSREYLREITKTGKNGVSAYYLLEASRELGFLSYGVKGSVRDINIKDLPVIAHVIIKKSYQHFVVIYKIDLEKNTMVIMDPAYGMKHISITEWESITTNNYLIFKPKKVIPKLVVNKSIIDIIFPVIQTYKTIFINVILLSMIYTIINIITSYNFKLLLEEVNIESLDNIKKIFFVLISFGLIKNLVNLFRNNLINYINYNLDKTLIKDIYCHIINLPYLYYKNRTTGDVITRINDLTNVKELISKLFITVLIDLILVVFILIILFSISTKLTVIALITMILYTIVMLISGKLLHKKVKESYQNASIVNSYLVETISAIDTIKSLSIQDKVCYELEKKYTKFSYVNKKLLDILNKENFFQDSILYIGNLLIIYIGAIGIKQGIFTLTNLITYISLLGFFMEPLKNIVDLNLVYRSARESLHRVLELYQIPKENIRGDKKYSIGRLNGDIIIKNLSYSYDGINEVIHNFSLEIKAKEKVLVYGKSGCGKSTLFKLLTKYLTDYRGIIKVDGYDLKSLNLIDVREKICYISQKETLFTDSIYNNIVLGGEVSYEKFLQVVQMTFVDDIIKNNALGYNSLLEENGFNLSGGERQRIITARGLLNDADIYIFDEALNAIDVDKERIILENIFKFLHDKTIIVISHRFNNSDLFDKRIKIIEGKYEHRND